MIKTLRFMLVSLLMMLCGTVFAEKVTMKYTGTETTNMTGENDAALLGLDASKWSVVASKGGNQNFPGLNKAGDIRLYYHANGNNTITVSALDGAIINSISMTFTGNTYKNVSVTADDKLYKQGTMVLTPSTVHLSCLVMRTPLMCKSASLNLSSTTLPTLLTPVPIHTWSWVSMLLRE